MSHVSVEEAATRLPDLIRESPPGEEIILTENSRPVAKLVPLPHGKITPRRGSGKDLIRSIADDFAATPEGYQRWRG